MATAAGTDFGERCVRSTLKARLARPIDRPRVSHLRKSDPKQREADTSSASQYHTPQSDLRQGAYSTHHTPISGYALNPSSAASSNVSGGDYLARQNFAEHHQNTANTVSMAQATSPSMSLQDGTQNDHHNPHNNIKSNPEVPVDPNIAASSPTYPPYSPYAAQPHEMNHYSGHPPANYPQHWPQQYHPHGMPGAPYSSPGNGTPGTPASSGPRPGQVCVDRPVSPLTSSSSYLDSCEQNPHALSQVYSFVPIPGAQQHKRPRRRYEEIERMYKCGWQGCEKAYGTLNHLNAHVTMQSHGSKRTPEGTYSIQTDACFDTFS